MLEPQEGTASIANTRSPWALLNAVQANVGIEVWRNVFLVRELARSVPAGFELYRAAKSSSLEDGIQIGNVSIQAAIGSATLGSIYYDLIRPPTLTRYQCSKLAATSLVIVEAVDNYIDSSGHSAKKNFELLDNVCDLLCGNKPTTTPPIGHKLLDFAQAFASTISAMPHREVFIDTLRSLVLAAKTEINGTCNIISAEHIGGLTVALAPALCLSAFREIPENLKAYLETAKSFGAIVKLIDDISDYSLDLAQDRNTFATQMQNFADARDMARERVLLHADIINTTLSQSDRAIYRTLFERGAHKWSLAEFSLTPHIIA